LQAAIDGLGIAFASEQMIAPHVAAGRLVPLLERWSAPFPGYFLCYPAQRQMSPPLRAFINSVRSKARQSEG
jgi:DNA-binding transcriptional LysR family regulator